MKNRKYLLMVVPLFILGGCTTWVPKSQIYTFNFNQKCGEIQKMKVGDHLQFRAIKNHPYDFYFHWELAAPIPNMHVEHSTETFVNAIDKKVEAKFNIIDFKAEVAGDAVIQLNYLPENDEIISRLKMLPPIRHWNCHVHIQEPIHP